MPRSFVLTSKGRAGIEACLPAPFVKTFAKVGGRHESDIGKSGIK